MEAADLPLRIAAPLPPLNFSRAAWSVLDGARSTIAFHFSTLYPKGSGQTVLYCAHRTSTVLSYSFGEQK